MHKPISVRAIAAVACFGLLAATMADAVVVQFSFDPTDLVELQSNTPYGPPNFRHSQENPRRLHVGPVYDGIPQDEPDQAIAFFQSFYNNTPGNPWYSHEHYADPAGGLIKAAPNNPFLELWNDNAGDGGGKIRLNYFNLWIPDQQDNPEIQQVYPWVPNPLTRIAGTDVTGSTGPNSDWSFADTGTGTGGFRANSPIFRTNGDIGVVDDDSLYRGAVNDFGTFTFSFRAPDGSVVDGQEYKFWFGFNGKETQDAHYGDPTQITDGTIGEIDQIAGFEGTLTLTAHVVPEPSTVAMIVLGLGALGFSAIRKRASRKALSLIVVLGLVAAATSAFAVDKNAPRLVRSDEPVTLVGLDGELDVIDAKGDSHSVRHMNQLVRIMPPAMVHVKRGQAVLRAGEMYMELKQNGWMHLQRNRGARNIRVMVPSQSNVPASVYVEAERIELQRNQAVDVNYDFVRQQVTVNRLAANSQSAPADIAPAVEPPVSNVETRTVGFSAEKGVPPLGAGHIPPVSPTLPPRAIPQQ